MKGLSYVWAWRVRPLDAKGQSYMGKPCRVLARGKMNSCLVEFEDGAKFITSRNGLRRLHAETS